MGLHILLTLMTLVPRTVCAPVEIWQDSLLVILSEEWTDDRHPPDNIGAWVLTDSVWIDSKETATNVQPEGKYLWYRPSQDPEINLWKNSSIDDNWHNSGKDSAYHTYTNIPNEWIWYWNRYKYKWVIYIAR